MTPTTDITTTPAVRTDQAGTLNTPPSGRLGIGLRALLALVATLASYLLLLAAPLIPGWIRVRTPWPATGSSPSSKQSAPILTVPVLAVLAVGLLAQFVDRRPFR